MYGLGVGGGTNIPSIMRVHASVNSLSVKLSLIHTFECVIYFLPGHWLISIQMRKWSTPGLRQPLDYTGFKKRKRTLYLKFSYN